MAVYGGMRGTEDIVPALGSLNLYWGRQKENKINPQK